MTPSWGNYPKTVQRTRNLDFIGDAAYTMEGAGSFLPYGMGRSYGDSCLNDQNYLLLTRRINRFIAFDDVAGILRCEAGVTLAEILDLVVPRGWFLHVTPGTKFVTVAGALANDVHGKNHHLSGTFGRFVRRFDLLRSDGTTLSCSPTENVEYYRATIGGLGLTGLVTWVEIQLKRITSSSIDSETVKFGNIDQFFQLSAESDREFEYTVSWIDCVASGRKLGRGLFMRGNHANSASNAELLPAGNEKLAIPFFAPPWLLNPLAVRAFNLLYYHKQLAARRKQTAHYEPFFYPLDAIGNWNRLYGRPGFLQYQCVVPYSGVHSPIRDILKMIADDGTGSFLAVLKLFGDVPSPGLLSFPRPGVTLALDFANRGDRVFRLLARLDEIVLANGGSVYPAKDARMAPTSFRKFFPKWREFQRYVDPKFSSSFWRRVGGDQSTEE